MSSPLSKEFREEYGFRSSPIRKSDRMMVMAGKFRGKVVEVRRKRHKVYLDSCEVSKINGQKSRVGVDASNLRITELCLERQNS